MCVGVSVTPDPKPRNVLVNACDQYVNIGRAKILVYPHSVQRHRSPY